MLVMLMLLLHVRLTQQPPCTSQDMYAHHQSSLPSPVRVLEAGGRLAAGCPARQRTRQWLCSGTRSCHRRAPSRGTGQWVSSPCTHPPTVLCTRKQSERQMAASALTIERWADWTMSHDVQLPHAAPCLDQSARSYVIRRSRLVCVAPQLHAVLDPAHLFILTSSNSTSPSRQSRRAGSARPATSKYTSFMVSIWNGREGGGPRSSVDEIADSRLLMLQQR